MKCKQNQSKLSTYILILFFCEQFSSIHRVVYGEKVSSSSIIPLLGDKRRVSEGPFAKGWRNGMIKRKQLSKSGCHFSYWVRNEMQCKSFWDSLICGFYVDQLSCTPIRHCQVTTKKVVWFFFLYIQLHLFFELN